MQRTPISLALAIVLTLGQAAIPRAVLAQVPLSRAIVSALRNRVRLLPQNRTPRSAAISDVMVPGDGLATGQQALADLRFNDGSLARLGEQAVFWFSPQTRTFQLSNGTVLLLIPPGQGGTRIQTPNVTTGIRGSALFVRYDTATDTTLVGALTDSGIEVTNADGSQRQVLAAGQMVVVIEDEIRHLYDFDLSEFYSTSYLVQGLQLDADIGLGEAETAIAAVRAETLAALALRPTLPPTESVSPLPDFVFLTSPTRTDVAIDGEFDLVMGNLQLPLPPHLFDGGAVVPQFIAASVFTLSDVAEFRSTDMMPNPALDVLNPLPDVPPVDNSIFQPIVDLPIGDEISPPVANPITTVTPDSPATGGLGTLPPESFGDRDPVPSNPVTIPIDPPDLGNGIVIDPLDPPNPVTTPIDPPTPIAPPDFPAPVGDIAPPANPPADPPPVDPPVVVNPPVDPPPIDPPPIDPPVDPPPIDPPVNPPVDPPIDPPVDPPTDPPPVDPPSVGDQDPPPPTTDFPGQGNGVEGGFPGGGNTGGEFPPGAGAGTSAVDPGPGSALIDPEGSVPVSDVIAPVTNPLGPEYSQRDLFNPNDDEVDIPESTDVTNPNSLLQLLRSGTD